MAHDAGARPLRIVQVLPALNAGGVERGTVEFARELVKLGHESYVISSGGRLVERLCAEGSRHIEMAVHRKSLRSLALVRPMRNLLRDLRPDIVHVRSRMPAWIVWLAWRKLPAGARPGLVSTFHGLYSVNRYSAIMAKAQRIIAISDGVYDYVVRNYPVLPERVTTIYRGVDMDAFGEKSVDEEWLASLYADYPGLKGRKIVLMPGRLSRWKGQEAFLHMMQALRALCPECHGVIVGGADKGKEHYEQELKTRCRQLGLDQQVTFTGHRADIQNFYALAAVVCHMSSKPEPFGRTVIEALATGVPVVAFDRGGAGETLKACFPAGLVSPDDIPGFATAVARLVVARPEIVLPERFLLSTQVSETVKVYTDLLAAHQS